MRIGKAETKIENGAAVGAVAPEAEEKNKRHREKILGEVAGALLKHCESPTEARNIADAIASGQIPHCKVEF